MFKNGVLSRIYHKVFYRYLRFRYRNLPYREFYSRVVDYHAEIDPRRAIGGKWDEIGTLQFDFLRQRGLEPHHTMLDFGCGCLRGGRLFIDYLEPEKYHGIDISANILAAARENVEKLGLSDRKPTLKQTQDMEFRDFPGQTFDFILAQSVLTHMPIEDVAQCFRNITRVMGPESRFFATFWEKGDTIYTPDYRNFFFPFPKLRELAHEAGLEARVDEGYVHPRRQQMMEITLRAD